MNKIEEPNQLISQALAGDTASFGKLYELYLDEIYQFIFYRVKSRQEAEDLTETVFIKAWQALDENPPRDVPFRLWLYRIGRNTIIDHYRKRKEHVALEEALHVPTEIDGPEMIVMHQERVEVLKQNIQKLAEDYQEVLTCRFIMGLSHSETAVVLSRSEQAVRALQYRAINALRNLITLAQATTNKSNEAMRYQNGNGAKTHQTVPLAAGNNLTNEERNDV